MRKKLITCGDSYMSPRITYPDKHCTQIFASELNLEFKTFARGGMSNGAIILQLLQAIKEKPDLIIFNFTYSDRIEFPIKQGNYDVVTHADLHYKYPYQCDELTTIDGNTGSFISDSLHSMLAPNNQIFYPTVKYDAIKSYFEELYDHTWKRQIDCMMLYSVLHLLQQSKIDHLLIIDYLDITNSFPVFKPVWLEPKNDVSKQVHEKYLNVPPPPGWIDPGFHTTLETQEEIAKFLIDHYNKYF